MGGQKNNMPAVLQKDERETGQMRFFRTLPSVDVVSSIPNVSMISNI